MRFFISTLILAPAVALAQHHPPRFQDYPSPSRYSGLRVAPRLRPGTDTWLFRTRIREAARGRPNFAGHYVLARWGCGAECLSSAIIDVKTGTVYFTDFTNCCWYSIATVEGKPDVEPIRFRLNSKLIIFAGLLNEAGRNGPHYFKFERGQLRALR